MCDRHAHTKHWRKASCDEALSPGMKATDLDLGGSALGYFTIHEVSVCTAITHPWMAGSQGLASDCEGT